MAETRESTHQIVDVLRMSDRDLQPILTMLARQDALPETRAGHIANAAAAPSSYPRLLIHICQQNSTTCTTYLVKPRDFDRDGIVFLHGGFIHHGARCAVLVRRRHGQPEQIPARIVSCRHVSGRVHELVAEFDRVISLDEYEISDGSSSAAGRE